MSRFPAPRGNAYATKIQAQSVDKAEYHGYAGAQDLVRIWRERDYQRYIAQGEQGKHSYARRPLQK
ncbi:hypothetical protein [Candidatus Sororendozoicomonas aggregata]|uniref:hypothetical protein n=1 Tax=Candidatus Sororendozoicomonas aggregata TaxID=3073239 RepID=UPI002ED5540C